MQCKSRLTVLLHDEVYGLKVTVFLDCKVKFVHCKVKFVDCKENFVNCNSKFDCHRNGALNHNVGFASKGIRKIAQQLFLFYNLLPYFIFVRFESCST